MAKKTEIKELTVKEIRDWYTDVVSRDDPDVVGSLLFPEDIPINDLPRFTNLSIDEIESMKPSELQEIIERVRDKNGPLFQLQRRLLQTAEAIAQQKNTSQSLTD